MTIVRSEKMVSDLSCMFTLYGSHPSQHGKINPDNRCNYDWLEANQGKASHGLDFPLIASEAWFEPLPTSYQEALKDQAFQSLYRVMTPSAADIALAAKGERAALTGDCLDALSTSNRPDTIPADLRIMRVHGWEPEKRVFIPLPAGKDAKLSDLVKANTKPDGFMVNVPMRPIGETLGEVDASAWRKGEASDIRVHQPAPLPPYQHPQRELTEGEKQVEAWLEETPRHRSQATRSSRMARMAARYWDKGDGHNGLQPVMDSNASLRALGRIAKAERYNRIAAQ